VKHAIYWVNRVDSVFVAAFGDMGRRTVYTYVGVAAVFYLFIKLVFA
jgi:hypothetical protein